MDRQGGSIFKRRRQPAEGWKRFTGTVLENESSLREFGISVNQPVWWSEPVKWLSEWRAYCAGGEVLDFQRCPHTPVDGPTPSMDVVARAAAAMFNRQDRISGIILDFGVLDTGQTALVEANDGFSFGAYGEVSAKTVWAVWTARWPELFATN
ncbi:ATP-grasp domain-containing protein [Polaromonas sp.]|uniref:ATP-grasp domain-containing protein n=1 Tax=Polaromonas sp. TaxID=1869339 RepID=UPI00352A0CAF